MNDEFINSLQNDFPDKMPSISASIVHIDGMELPSKLEKFADVLPLKYLGTSDNMVSIKDNRSIHPVTGNPINPNKDLFSGEYNKGIISDIISESKKVGYDPYKALAVGLFESKLGQTDDNIGHVINPMGKNDTTVGVTPDISQMVSTLKYWDDKSRKNKKYNTDEYALQAYNSPAVLDDSNVFLNPKTEKKYLAPIPGHQTDSFYGIDVTKKPLNLKENPAYGKTVMSLANMLKENPELQKMINYSNNKH
jgi:hypothetical protein